jgi:hypothetical protein
MVATLETVWGNWPGGARLEGVEVSMQGFELTHVLQVMSARQTVAQHYRQKAKKALMLGAPRGQKQLPPDSERAVEQIALGLFERDLSLLPPALTSGPSLAQTSAYAGLLGACLHGTCSGLSPTVLQALEGFRADLLELREGNCRYLGDTREAALAAEAVSCQLLPSGVRLLGAWDANEAEIVEATLQQMLRKIPASRGLIQTVVLRTHIGENLDESGRSVSTVAGLFDRRYRGELGLLRLQVRRPDGLDRTLFHEAGHELDLALGNGDYRSQRSDTPFAQAGSEHDYVTAYATKGPEEDFAETHADLLLHWDLYQSQPTLFLHAQGKIAQKRRWILKYGYGCVIPESGPNYKLLLAQVREGLTPLRNVEDLGDIVSQLVRNYNPHKLRWEDLPNDERGRKLAWVFQRVMGRQFAAAA